MKPLLGLAVVLLLCTRAAFSDEPTSTNDFTIHFIEPATAPAKDLDRKLMDISLAPASSASNTPILSLVKPATATAKDRARNLNDFSLTPDQPALNKFADAPKHITNRPSAFENLGALSNVVAGTISNINITWVDTNQFKTHGESQGVLQRLLSAGPGSPGQTPYCETFTSIVWSEGLGFPSITAIVEHKHGMDGQLILFGVGFVHFAYQDRLGGWWFGRWSEASDKNH